MKKAIGRNSSPTVIFVLSILFSLFIAQPCFSEDRPEKQAGAKKMKMQRSAVSLTKAEKRLLGVKTYTVKPIRLTKIIRASGRLDYNESRLAEINLRTGGWIERLYADSTGKYVRKGEPLLTIYSPELVAAQKEFLIMGKNGAGEKKNGSAEKKLLLLGLTGKQIEKLRKKGAPSTHVEILSPISGYVILKSVLAGSHVKPGQTLFRIADISRLWVLGDIYESDIPWVKTGQKAIVTLPSFPGKKFPGKITYIYPYLSPRTRSVKARIELANPGEKLKPEMYANVRIEISAGNRLAVPQSGMLDSGLRKVVFVRDDKGRFVPREVVLDSPVGDLYPVISGLKDGETIVSFATFFIDSESRLKASMEGMMGLIGMGDWKMESAKMGGMDMKGMDMKSMDMGGMKKGMQKDSGKGKTQ